MEIATSAVDPGTAVTRVAARSSFGPIRFAVSDVIDTSLWIGVDGQPGSTRTLMSNVALAPFFRLATAHLTPPRLPGGAVVHVNVGPLVCATETRVAVAGIASTNATFAASTGPLFTTVTE